MECTMARVEEEGLLPVPLVVFGCPRDLHSPYPPGFPEKVKVVGHPCEECGEVLKTAAMLEEHTRDKHPILMQFDENVMEDQETPKPWYQCEWCVYKTHKVTGLRRHVCRKHRTEAKAKKEQNEEEKFSKRSAERSKEKIPVIKCRSCNFQASPLGHRASMRRHLEEEHGSSVEVVVRQFSRVDLQGSLVCQLCLRKCRSKEQFRRHMMRRHNIGAFSVQCTVCGKSFRQQHYLRKHMGEEHSSLQLSQSMSRRGDLP